MSWTRLLIIIDFCIFIVFFLLLYWSWKIFPNEGVKLHGTVDLGVDLLGSKNDLVWYAIFAATIFGINLMLSYFLSKRDKIASLYLIITTGLILILLLATLLFLLQLNGIF